MFREWINQKCKEATEKVQRVLGGNNYWFDWNNIYHRFEFREQRQGCVQTVFPLTLGGDPLRDITDWEIEHAVKFVRNTRHKKAEENYRRQQINKQYGK